MALAIQLGLPKPLGLLRSKYLLHDLLAQTNRAKLQLGINAAPYMRLSVEGEAGPYSKTLAGAQVAEPLTHFPLIGHSCLIPMLNPCLIPLMGGAFPRSVDGEFSPHSNVERPGLIPLMGVRAPSFR